MAQPSDNLETKKLTWQAENTHPNLIEAFTESMREVVDPEIGLNIIELGLIRDLMIDDSCHNLWPLENLLVR